MQIDHDPDEQKIDRGPGPWRLAFPLLILLWVGYLYTAPFDWHSIAIGLATGVIVTAWAIETTGNKVPASWRSKPPGAGRP